MQPQLLPHSTTSTLEDSTTSAAYSAASKHLAASPQTTRLTSKTAISTSVLRCLHLRPSYIQRSSDSFLLRHTSTVLVSATAQEDKTWIWKGNTILFKKKAFMLYECVDTHTFTTSL